MIYHFFPESGGVVLLCMGYVGMWHCASEWYGFQAAKSEIGFRNQNLGLE